MPGLGETNHVYPRTPVTPYSWTAKKNRPRHATSHRVSPCSLVSESQQPHCPAQRTHPLQTGRSVHVKPISLLIAALVTPAGACTRPLKPGLPHPAHPTLLHASLTELARGQHQALQQARACGAHCRGKRYALRPVYVEPLVRRPTAHVHNSVHGVPLSAASSSLNVTFKRPCPRRHECVGGSAPPRREYPLDAPAAAVTTISAGTGSQCSAAIETLPRQRPWNLMLPWRQQRRRRRR